MSITSEVFLESPLDNLDNKIGWAETKNLRVTNIEIDNVVPGSLHGLCCSDDVSDRVVELCGSS